jgi:hypothetical protein
MLALLCTQYTRGKYTSGSGVQNAGSTDVGQSISARPYSHHNASFYLHRLDPDMISTNILTASGDNCHFGRSFRVVVVSICFIRRELSG